MSLDAPSVSETAPLTMSFEKLNLFNSKNPPQNDSIFLKYLSQYYQSEFDVEGLNYRKLKLRDSIVKAYNQKFKTKLKGYELLEELKRKEKSFQPYEWQKLFLDVFDIENEETPNNTNPVKSNATKLAEILEMAKKDDTIEPPNVKQDVQDDDVCDDSAKCSYNTSNVVSLECKPDIPLAAQDMDYKTMSIYELKRALLISKLEMLDAQEALRRAKENIRLNEEEHLNRRIEEQ